LTTIETNNAELMPLKTQFFRKSEQAIQEILSSPASNLYVFQPNVDLKSSDKANLEKIANCTLHRDVIHAYSTLVLQRSVTLWMSEPGSEMQLIISNETLKNQRSAVMLEGGFQEDVQCIFSRFNLV